MSSMREVDPFVVGPIAGASRVQIRHANLIPILQEIQRKHLFLPEPVLRKVAASLDIALVDVYRVATFYNCFTLEPVGRNLVQVCLGTACQVRGAARVLEQTLRALNLSHPGTVKNREFTVRTVRCMGCCGLAPVLRVNENTHGRMNPVKVQGLLQKYKRREVRPMEA